MKSLLCSFLVLCTLTALSQKTPPERTAIGPIDLKAEINQSAFDKILAYMTLPLVLFEHREPFPGLLPDFNGEIAQTESDDKIYNYEDLQSLISWAVNNTSDKIASAKDNEFKDDLKRQWSEAMQEVNQIIANYDYALKNQSITGYNGPKASDFEGGDISIDELKRWQRGEVKLVFEDLSKRTTSKVDFLRAHLAHAKVELTSRPAMAVNSPSFSLTNVLVRASATGELWAKLPQFRCCRRVFGICVWVCFDGWKWTRIGSATVGLPVGANATVDFAVEKLQIFATATFTKLFIDYFILREINLAAIGNRYMRNRKFEVYDVSKFVASIPYIERKFRVKDINLPQKTGSVAIEVNIINQ